MILQPIFNVILPVTAVTFYEIIFEIVSFDIFEGLGDIINWGLSLDTTEPMRENFGELGFGSTYILNNMGTMALYFVCYLLLMLLQWMLAKCKDCSPRIFTLN